MIRMRACVPSSHATLGPFVWLLFAAQHDGILMQPYPPKTTGMCVRRLLEWNLLRMSGEGEAP